MMLRSRTVRARKTSGVAKATCTWVKSGSVSSRVTESTIWPPSPCTTMRSCTWPGGALKLTVRSSGDLAEPTSSGTPPLKSATPSGVLAVSAMRAGWSA
jgi:hypothetical protein